VKKNGSESAAKCSTSQLLRSIPNVPCLKRHQINGNYYAVKKIRGKIKTHALRSESGIVITDRKLAERKLREWLDGLEREELSPAPPINFSELLEKYRAVNAGKSPKTRGNIEWAINTLRKSWKRGFDVPVATILASDVSSWLARQNNFKPNSYNELSRQLKNIFELALNDRVISVSPYAGITNKRKRVNKEPDPIPSSEQFRIIVEAIRHQRFADHAQDSADLAAFLGLAALGQAEARQFQWKDFDFSRPGFSVRRQKTGKYFEVPFYPYLENLLVDLYECQGRPHENAKAFRVADCKKTLRTVCRQLGFPHFSPRSLRKFGIVRLLQRGVNVKFVSKWQGHQDGGKLILDTYSDVIGDSDKAFNDRNLRSSSHKDITLSPACSGRFRYEGFASFEERNCS
jgi:integrase